MFSHIVRMTDLSARSEAAAELAQSLALALPARVSVVFARGGLPDPDRLGQRGVEAAAAALRARGVEAEGVEAEGQPDELAAAYEGTETLLIVGRTGLSGLDRLLLGSTTQRVLRAARVPVLVVGGRVSAPPHRLLVPIELDPLAPSPIAAAVELARMLQAELTFLHVEPINDTDPPEARLERLRARVHAELENPGLHLRFEVGWGEETAAAIAVAAESYDLVIVGTHGRRGFARLALGSVAETLAASSPVPVLVLHAG